MSSAERFYAAVKVIDSLPQNGPFQPSQELLLKFYAYHKQATEGPCNTEKPYFWDVIYKQKWNAWKNLGDMSKEEAMERYVEELVKIIETMSYNEDISNFMDTMGPLYETVWLDEAETEASGSAEPEMSDSSFEVIKQEPDVNVEERCVDISILHNANQAVEKAKHTFQFVNPYSPQQSRSKKAQKMSFAKPEVEKHSSSRNKGMSSSNRLKVSDKERFGEAVGSSVLRHSRAKPFSRNIPRTMVKEILFISVVGLQHSLEEVMKRLDKIEVLVKAHHALGEEECTHHNKNSSVLGLPYWATMFVILWPFVLAQWQKR